MYKIQLIIANPQTGESRVIERKFDETNFTQTKWNGAYPVVKQAMDELVTASTPNEPPTW